MLSRNDLKNSKGSGSSRRLYDKVEDRISASAARGKAPARTHFGKHRMRFVDKLGRVYILPIKGDLRANQLMDTGEVRRFFDPEYASDDVYIDPSADENGEGRMQQIGQQLPTLRGSVFMYAWRPRNVTHVDERTGEPISAMPATKGSAGDDGLDFYLYECDESFKPVRNGAQYKADVKRTESKRRSERGHVIFDNVTRIN